MDAVLVTGLCVVPAKAGTHEHGRFDGLPSAFMDARLRGHDVPEKCVGLNTRTAP
jgi:hypothetical protein